MPISIVVPQLGESVAEGTVSKWLKQVGERVRKDEPLVEIQTDKINVELPSPAEGVLEAIIVPEGSTVLVGTEIGVLGIAAADGAAAPAAAAAPAPAKAAAAPAPAKAAAAPAPAAAPAAPVRGAEAAPVGAPIPVAPPLSAPAEAPAVPEAAGDSARQGNLSPAVRKLMREHNVAMSEIAAIRGTGLAGRVSRDDLLEYLKGRATPPGATAATPPSALPAAPAASAARPTPAASAVALPGFAPAASAAPAGPREEVIPFTKVRKLIAENMIRAKHTAAHTHCFDETDMSAIIALRKEWAPKLEAQGVHLTYMPFFIKAAVLALKEFPWVNGEVRGETMVVKRTYNIGIAVGREEKGLIVPNLKDCDRKNLVQLAGEVNDLAARARAERLRPDEIAGGTFSITNAGVYGALNSAPVINVPEVAILGVHKIAERPVARGGQVVVRPMMNLAIGFDHRVVDGELAVKFLRRVCELLERPELLWFYA
jgi:pyruvate/2-oxoglutarate dehydrogenase complex dihydrolipoamide acyltransferase (E2) component